MTRLKQFLAVAAALIAGGLGLNEALNTAMQREQINCAQIREMGRELKDVQKKRHFYLGIEGAVGDIPLASGSYTLGLCANGECSLSGCGLNANYDYEVLKTTAQGRLVKVFAHPYFARGWQDYASKTAGWHFWGSMAEVKNACLSRFSGAQCANLLGATSQCWRQADDTLCRYGYTPAGEQCAPTNTSTPIPCVCYGSSACVNDETTQTLNDLDP